MFEEYGFKGVYISIQAVLTLYAQGMLEVQFFPSIDGLKWRDLVMGRWSWWLVNFDVSAVRCPVSQRVSCVKLRKADVAM